ncbi:MAG: peptidylprolyl isomerase [Lentisphaeria bacterium]|nr:peptidylprolyl isomerase [Lentisphaeria bacterium]
MIAELFEDEVPNTVANMISLAEAGFYRGMQFHRIINGFMAQGGCPFSKRNLEGGAVGTGDPGYKFADEFSPKLKHTERGILSMANSGKNTNGSQFFICFGPTPHLDGKHAVFGKVIKGMEVLDKLEAAGTRSGKPSKDIQFNIEVLTKRDHPYVVKKLTK